MYLMYVQVGDKGDIVSPSSKLYYEKKKHTHLFFDAKMAKGKIGSFPIITSSVP